MRRGNKPKKSDYDSLGLFKVVETPYGEEIKPNVPGDDDDDEKKRAGHTGGGRPVQPTQYEVRE